jgi:3D (Asp-Asp-Asp) domain-containing protein
MIVRAYSPWDAVDKEYRLKHPIPITARGNYCSEHPFGIAAYLPDYPRGTTITVPGYNDDKPTIVDDTGGSIRKAQREGKEVWIEVRFKTEAEAKRWGCKTIKVKITKP